MYPRNPGTRSPVRVVASRGALVAASLVVGAAVMSGQSAVLKDVMPRGILIGAAVNTRQVSGGDATSSDIVARQFSSISPENALKWGPIHPAADRFAFEPADQYVAFGRAQGLAVIGHCLVWHQQTPAWVFAGEGGAKAGRDVLLARMREHITTVVDRYKGRIRGWDVVNEAVEEDGTLRKSPWLDGIGEDFIAKAFEYAHAADPDAELYYNDYNLWKPEKRATVIRIVKGLRARGLRVDAVGEQAHWGIDEPPLPEVDATLTELAAGTGVKVMLTELDVDVLPRDPDMWGADLSKQTALRGKTNIYPDGLPPAQQQKLARRYADIFTLVLKHRATMSRVTFWGVTDATTWLHNFPIRGRVNYPLLWDTKGQPKPAFAAVVEALRTKR